ncbi:MAG: hypothetical protein IJQ59_09985 [Bacteroidaceae bacterium]|nr:hypothetical protein [Bacteroidaceae bacterium]
MKATKESRKERKESKESKKAVVVAEALKTTTTNAGAREYPKDQPLEVVTKADLQYFVEYFNGEICRMQAVIPAIDTLDSICQRQLTALLHKYPMAKLEKMATMAAESDFLNGGGQRGFKADLEWLTREQNFLKVVNGKYCNIPAHRRWRDPAAVRAEAEAQRRELVRQVEREEHERRMREREEWAKGAVTYEEYQRMKKRGEIDSPPSPLSCKEGEACGGWKNEE